MERKICSLCLRRKNLRQKIYQVGDVVTWGTGRIAYRITSVDDKNKSVTVNPSYNVRGIDNLQHSTALINIDHDLGGAYQTTRCFQYK